MEIAEKEKHLWGTREKVAGKDGEFSTISQGA